MYGFITNITDFGLFVEVEEGIEGLVHVSELSNKKVKTPAELYKEGEEIQAKIIHVSAEDRRLGLSIKQLKDEGVWVFGTAAQGNTSLYKADLKGPAAIVIGSEGDGMTRLAAENCDFLVSIRMRGKLNSLNASAAAAILLYEAVRQRMA